MQYLLVCLVALLNFALGVLPITSYSNDAVQVGSTIKLSQSQHHVAPQHTGLITDRDDLDTAIAINYATPSNLIARDDVSVRSAQADCYIRDDGDVRIQFTDGILAMITNVPSDDFPYDLSVSGAEIYCTIPPSGTCAPCERNTTNVEVKYAKPNSWCFFLFTQEFGGTGYESFYVYWYQGLVKLHNPGFIKIVMCHDEDESKVKRKISAEGNATTALAQGGCNSDPDSYEIELSMGSTTFSTNIPSDGNDHRLGQPNPDLNCTSSGQCKYCTDQAESVTLRNVPERAHCDLLFTENVEGGYIFGLSVSQGPDSVMLPKSGTLAVAKCFKPVQRVDNWISRLQSPTSESAEGTAAPIKATTEVAQAGCDADPDSLRLSLGMDLNSFLTYVPADGQDHRLGQPNPELKCFGFGQCKDCRDSANYVYLLSGAATSHCDLLFTESVDGGYVFSVSITKEQHRIDLPKLGVLAMAKCFKPGQQATESWISRLQAPEAEAVQVSPIETSVSPAARSLSTRDDLAGCVHNDGDKLVPLFFGTADYNFTTWVPIDGKIHALGQPIPDLKCRREHDSETVCVECWAPVTWVTVPAGFETPNCVLTLTNDLEGNGRVDITLDKTLFLWEMASEVSLALVVCKPASSKRQAIEAAVEPATSLEVIEPSQVLPTAVKRSPAAPSDVTCQLGDRVISRFVLHGGKGINSTIEVKNDGKWHVFGDTVDADLMCYENTGSFGYCDYCQHHIDYIVIYSQIGITCYLSTTPASDEGVQFSEFSFHMTGPQTSYNIERGGDNYYFKVKCAPNGSKMAHDGISAGNTSDSNPVESAAVSGGVREIPLLGALVPLALLPLVGIN